MGYHFIDEDGSFVLEEPDNSSYLYLPLVNPAGVMSSITPDGHGDNKLSQDEFLLPPVSACDLHGQAPSRNFWCYIRGYGPWSVYGQSAAQESRRYTDHAEPVSMTAGPFWQKIMRTCPETGLKAEVLSFCPVTDTKAELMKITLINEGDKPISLVPLTAILLFGRGADHIRDHRHVTSLLQRFRITEDGIVLTPSMTFDERGHQVNRESYGVFARQDANRHPDAAIPLVDDFIGEGGSLLWPQAVVHMKQNDLWKSAGDHAEGKEGIAALRFAEITLQPHKSTSFQIVMSYNDDGKEYLNRERMDEAFLQMKEYWSMQKSILFKTGDSNFDFWMQWVTMQPQLRRIYGCSFLPYHDYGRGGRGWRDLWQDCLALILNDPEQVRGDLLSFFAGVRIDGSNATIIGSRPGEFKADRNEIVRVWMDHGYWPYATIQLYLDASGDYDFLFEKNTYFSDSQLQRGELISKKQNLTPDHQLMTKNGKPYEGTVLEHLLVQQLTQFYDVGDHNHMRLRGADWNDALDMAADKGKSVAFTAAYAANIGDMAKLLRHMKEHKKTDKVWLAEEILLLLEVKAKQYESSDEKQQILKEYCEKTGSGVSGKRKAYPVEKLASQLDWMSAWIQNHIRMTETVEDGEGSLWFNGYYDNHGDPVEKSQDGVRMMLTGQVFAILSGTATDEQVARIARAADRYLYDQKVGGYRLNTDFHETKMDLGRMFGFAYGNKENGAVFCHMAVMYAYALYERRFAKEGFKVMKSLYEQSADFDSSRIYPGIPEYFDPDGRGMYTYLTGAASWMVLTVMSQMYGVRGYKGNLQLLPQLLAEQFDRDGCASVTFHFAGRKLNVVYINRNHLEVGDYEVEEILLDKTKLSFDFKKPEIKRELIKDLSKDEIHKIRVILQ